MLGAILDMQCWVLYWTQSCNAGCYVGHRCVSSFMYADDVILSSISVTDMLKLVDVCIYYLIEELDIKKCNFIRVEPRFKNTCSPIFYKNMTFNWIQEARYLGIFVISGKKFFCNYRTARQKFFRAFNSIYEKVDNNDSVILLY